MNDVMLFPLSSAVLPEGKMNLRIFEPRYKRLVKECSLRNIGFGICLVDSIGEGGDQYGVSLVGTLVTIIDFETLSDGLLGITVVGEQRFKIKSVWADADGLRHANVEWLDNWSDSKESNALPKLSKQLANVYEQFPQLAQLYDYRFYDDASWVTQRWLEILPISCHLFDQLAGADSCFHALQFLDEAIDVPSQHDDH